jgi:hypothetical protein
MVARVAYWRDWALMVSKEANFTKIVKIFGEK